MTASLAAPELGEIGGENGDGLEVIHCEFMKRSTGGFEGIDDGWWRFDGRNPFVDVNEAGGRKNWNIEIARESTMPGDEAILEVGHGVAVRVFDDGCDGICSDAFPAKRIVCWKSRQRTDVLYHSKAIEVLEPAQTHRVWSSPRRRGSSIKKIGAIVSDNIDGPPVFSSVWISVVCSSSVWYSVNTFSYTYP